MTAFDRVPPPAELARDWVTVRDAFADLRTRLTAIDLTAPDATQQVTDALAQLRARAGSQFQRISEYAQSHCPDLASPPS